MAPLQHRDSWQLETRHVGRRVLLFDSLPSTNDYASTLAATTEESGVVVVADVQTAGRGQHGRVWQSRAGASLLMSVLIRPPLELRRPVILTAWAAVAVAEAIRTLTGVQARIKWPNDLLIRGRKVCGILIEQRVGTVVGIGLNLNQTLAEFTDAGLPQATSLGAVAGSLIEQKQAIMAVIQHLDDEYDRLVNGELIPLESDWKWRIGLLGRQVIVELTDGSRVSGRLREMAFEGLAIEDANGEIVVLKPESVGHIFEAFRGAEE